MPGHHSWQIHENAQALHEVIGRCGENRQKEMIGLVSVTAAHFLANDLTCVLVAFVQIGL